MADSVSIFSMDDPDEEEIREKEKALRERKKRNEERKKSLERRIQLDTEEEQVYESEELVYEREENYTRIKHLLSQAKELIKLQKFDDASDCIASVQKIDPENLRAKQMEKDIKRKLENETVKALLEEAERYEGTEEYDQALECVKECLKMDPTNWKAKYLEKKLKEKKTQQTVKALLEKAERYEGTEEYDQALECVKECLNMDPTNLKAKYLEKKLKEKKTQQTVKALLKEAERYEGTEEYDQALGCVKECLNMDPTNLKAKDFEKKLKKKKTQQTVKALLEEAKRYEGTEEYDNALEYVKECLKMDPTNSKAKDLEKKLKKTKKLQMLQKVVIVLFGTSAGGVGIAAVAGILITIWKK